MKKEIIQIPKGTTIFREGEDGGFMYIIHKGKVRISRKGIEIAVLEKGDFFGDISLLTGQPRVADAEAIEDCELLYIDELMFDEMMKKHPDISLRLLRKLAARLRSMYEILDKLGGLEREEGEEEAEREKLPGNIMAWLELKEGEEKFPLKYKVTFIGRRDLSTGFFPEVDLTKFDPFRYVSRRHARIHFKNDKFYLQEEIGVLNGTFLNGHRISTGSLYPLEDEDEIRLGKVVLKFRVTKI